MLSRKEQERLYKVLEDVSKMPEWPGVSKPSRIEMLKVYIATIPYIPMKTSYIISALLGITVGLLAIRIPEFILRENKAKSEYLRSEQELLESQRQYHDILSNHVRWMDEHLSNIDRMLGRTNGEWKTK